MVGAVLFFQAAQLFFHTYLAHSTWGGKYAFIVALMFLGKLLVCLFVLGGVWIFLESDIKTDGGPRPAVQSFPSTTHPRKHTRNHRRHHHPTRCQGDAVVVFFVGLMFWSERFYASADERAAAYDAYRRVGEERRHLNASPAPIRNTGPAGQPVSP